MNKPHKHAEVIKAWADGVAVQYRESSLTEWNDLDPPPSSIPAFLNGFEYRIKPKLKDPGEVASYAWYKKVHSDANERWSDAAKAVIDAYKAGELDL